MPTFYVTTAENMPHGAGYWEVHAQTEAQARALAFTHCPDGRWSFIYPTLGAVHPRDRVRHGVIGAPDPAQVQHDVAMQQLAQSSDAELEPLVQELRDFVREHIDPPRIPLRDRLSATMRAVHQCQAEAPGFHPLDVRTLVLELLSDDPEVHGSAMAELEAKPVCAAWCRNCGFTFARVPIIAQCEECDSRQIARWPAGGTT